MTSSTTPEGSITRRNLLRAGVAAAGVAVLGGAGYGVSRLIGTDHTRFLDSWRVTTGAGGDARRFHSVPELVPPATDVTLAGGGQPSAGYLFIGPARIGGAQSGPMIVDDIGDPVWFQRQASGSWLTNFGVQSYRGMPVLAWWEGDVFHPGYGRGEAVIADSSYREIARVKAARGRQMDLHELLLTDRGTALFTCAPATVASDLSAIGGPSSAIVRESIFQEVEIATGRLVMEWRSLAHVDPAESYRHPSDAFDYLHLNSIDVAPDGNLLVSARHTWALYKLERTTGAVMWRLGGKRTQFVMGPGAQFAWQHDGRQVNAGTLTVFDNGDDGVTNTQPTRGLLLAMDEPARRVGLTRAYRHPRGFEVTAMGSARLLANGHVAVGWGAQPYVTEFDDHGAPVADLRIGKASSQKSYRGLRQTWSARPIDKPAVAASRDRSSGRATAYVSWNGATAVASWRIDAGPRRTELRPLGVVPRRGFETAINLGTGDGHVAIVGLDHRGRALGRSPVVAV